MPDDFGSRRLLDPLTLTKISNMYLRARFVVEGVLTGLHKSAHMGSSVEFVEHKEYTPGDEIKHIDWKVLGRSDKLYVRQFEDETNLRAYLLVDASASMGYASGAVSKLRYASFCAAALAYLMLQQGDSVGLVLFDESIRTYVPPRAKSSHLPVVLESLESAEPRGQTNLPRVLEAFAERVKRRGLIILFSDLLENVDAALESLRLFRHRSHEVVVFQVLDPWEIDFPFEQSTLFVSMEDNRRVLTNPKAIAQRYRSELSKLLHSVRDQCLAEQMDYWLFDTSRPVDEILTEYLASREHVACSAYPLPNRGA